MASEMATWLRWNRVWKGIWVNLSRHSEIHRSQRHATQWDHPLQHLAEAQTDRHADHPAKAQGPPILGAIGPLHRLALLRRVSNELDLIINSLCRKASDSIMLVEPGMLLMYRSAEKHPRMTDMLVEYLDNYIRTYDPSRVDEAFLSVQKVFTSCE